MNALGSIQKWLTFGLSADQEDRFRQANFSMDIAQARVCIFVISLILVAFAVTDYYLVKLSWIFYGLLAVRLALVVYSIWVIKSLPKLTNYQSYDRTEFFWGFYIATFVITVAAMRPAAFIAHIIVVVLSVLLTVLTIPNRFTNQLTISMVYTIGETLVLAHSLRTSLPAYTLRLFSACSLLTPSPLHLAGCFTPIAGKNF